MTPAHDSTRPRRPSRAGRARLARIGAGLAMILAVLLPVAPAHAAGQDLDVRDHGAVGDGQTDDTAAFERALAAFNNAGGSLTLSGGRFAVGGIVVPANVTLRFTGGGMLLLTGDRPIEIRGRLDAGLETIFAGDGAVLGQPANLQVYPQWFGAVGDGQTDDTAALQKAADLAARSLGRLLVIPGGEYLYQDHLTLRCHIECRGLLVRNIEIDESRTVSPPGSPLPSHYPTREALIRFVPDAEAVELAVEPFYGIQEGALSVPVSKDVPLASGEGSVTLAAGGTLRFYSTDFFSSRHNGKGDEYYDRNDIMQVVTGMGDVFPEFAFSYDRPPAAEAWSPEQSYSKGSYATRGGEVFKATWPSGPGAGYTHPYLGAVAIGPVEPDPASATTVYRYAYASGAQDSITAWRRVRTQVWYRPKDTPLTVDGLRVEIRLANHGGQFKRINSSAVAVGRSNLTLNRLEITVREREAMMSSLLSVGGCVNVEVNNATVSGATYHGLGYNMLNSNAANIRYNDCISTNSRKGLDGRHGKNISVRGGFYNTIEDHYGRNMTIRDVVMSGLSTDIPGYTTPAVNLDAWGFVPRRPFGFSGANLHIENCVVDRAPAGLFGVRGDIGDLYGTVVLKAITVRRNPGDVSVFTHAIAPDFDFAHRVRVPSSLIIEDIVIEQPGRLHITCGNGFPDGAYGPVQIRHCGPIGRVETASAAMTFTHCRLDQTRFTTVPGSVVSFLNCVFAGTCTGLDESAVAVAAGNAAEKGAGLSFPLNHANPDRYADAEAALRRGRALRDVLKHWDLLPDVPPAQLTPVLELQGDTDMVEDGPAGVALVIPFPGDDRQQGAVVRNHPALFPEGPLSIEVVMMPDPRLYEKLADSRWQSRATLVDTMAVDYVHQSPSVECKQGYQMDLRYVDATTARLAVTLGFGRDQPLATYQTAPIAFQPGQWYRVLFTYDGKGTGRIVLDGALAAEATHDGRARILPSRRNALHIGERATSTYRSFPGRIGRVRLWHQAVNP